MKLFAFRASNELEEYLSQINNFSDFGKQVFTLMMDGKTNLEFSQVDEHITVTVKDTEMDDLKKQKLKVDIDGKLLDNEIKAIQLKYAKNFDGKQLSNQGSRILEKNLHAGETPTTTSNPNSLVKYTKDDIFCPYCTKAVTYNDTKAGRIFGQNFLEKHIIRDHKDKCDLNGAIDPGVMQAIEDWKNKSD